MDGDRRDGVPNMAANTIELPKMETIINGTFKAQFMNTTVSLQEKWRTAPLEKSVSAKLFPVELEWLSIIHNSGFFPIWTYSLKWFRVYSQHKFNQSESCFYYLE